VVDRAAEERADDLQDGPQHLRPHEEFDFQVVCGAELDDYSELVLAFIVDMAVLTGYSTATRPLLVAVSGKTSWRLVACV